MSCKTETHGVFRVTIPSSCDDTTMNKISPYTPDKVKEIRSWTKDCSSWLEARDRIVERLDIHPDNATRMNRRHGFWTVEEIRGKGPAVQVQRAGRKLRRLFMDIETSPNVVLSWRIGFKINLDHSNILKERAVICIGWKWGGESEIHSLHWDENQNDKTMLEKFAEVAEEADEIVMHNGDRFDLPWFKTRCLFHGIHTFPEYKTVDTLQWARRKFYFNSNRLDYIAKFLGLGGKIKTEFGLWKEIVLNKCPESMRLMLTYCKRDVGLLEQVWKRLSDAVPHKTHVGVLAGKQAWSCPYDGSTNVTTHKTQVSKLGTITYQMRCKDCSRYYMISEKAHRDFLTEKKS